MSKEKPDQTETKSEATISAILRAVRRGEAQSVKIYEGKSREVGRPRPVSQPIFRKRKRR